MERASVSAISLRHILASPGYAPGTIAVNVTWMKKRIRCLSNALQHVHIYLQQFHSNSIRKFKSSPFFAHFGLPWVHFWTIAVNVTWMETGFNAGQTHRSMHLQLFTGYSEILVGICNFFLPPCI